MMYLDSPPKLIEAEIFSVMPDTFRHKGNGDIYFTDQGQTGLHDPTGRVYRLATSGRLDCLVDTGVSPNGLVLDRAGATLFVAVTRDNAVWRLPFMKDGSEGRPLLLDLRHQRPGRPDHGPGRMPVRRRMLRSAMCSCSRPRRTGRADQVLRRACLHQCRDRRQQWRRLYITESSTGTVMVVDISDESLRKG